MTDNRPNILQLISTDFIGGPEKQIINHLKHVDKDRYNILIASYLERGASNELLDYLKKNQIQVRSINHPYLLDFSLVGQLKSIIRQDRIDVLISHGYKSNIIGYHATSSLSIPQAMYVRGWTSENWRINLFNKLDRRYLRQANLVVTVAENKKAELIRLGIDKEKIRCIANAVNMPDDRQTKGDLFRARYDIPGDALLFVTAGRLSPEKGHRQLIMALGTLVSKGVNFHCVIFGDGFLRSELVDLIKEGNLGERIILAGFQPDWTDCLDEADLLINPSLSEVMPNVVLEGMAHRCPIVATDVGGVNELITEGETGYLAEPGDPAALVAAILKFVANRSSVTKIVDNAYWHVSENYSFESQAKKLHSLYEELYKLRRGNC